jgi:hypothetical protein
MSTLADFVSTLQALDVSGVKRVFLAPPPSVTTADLPAMFLNGARRRGEPLSKGVLYWPVAEAELFIVVSPVSQSRPEKTFNQAVVLADALADAIEAASFQGLARVEVRVATITINEKSFWGVVSRIEAQG